MITESERLEEESFVPGLVSIIIPTYNRRDLIIDTLESVAAQTYRPIEIIGVDDGSTDGTAEVVTQWFNRLDDSQRSELQCRIHRQGNSGVSRAINVGFSLSRGEFIQCLDSDDLLHRKALDLYTEALRQNGSIAFVYSGLTTFQDTVTWPSNGVAPCEIVEDIETGWMDKRLNNSCLHRRAVWRKIGGYNEAISTFNDIEFLLRLIASGAKVGYVSGALIAYREHPGPRVSRPGSAATALAGFRAVAKVVEEHLPLTNRVRDCLAGDFWRIALAAMMRSDLEVARDALREARAYKGSRSRQLKTLMLESVLRARLSKKFYSAFADVIFRVAGTKSFLRTVSLKQR